MNINIDEILNRACARALPRIKKIIEENIKKEKAKKKYLKRVKNSKK